MWCVRSSLMLGVRLLTGHDGPQRYGAVIVSGVEEDL